MTTESLVLGVGERGRMLPAASCASRGVPSSPRARPPAPSSLPPWATEVIPRWTAGRAIGAAILLASMASLAVVWGLSWSGAEDAVVDALSDQLVVQAHLVGEPLQEVPLAVLVELGKGHAAQAVDERLATLRTRSGLHDAAVIGPDDVVLGSDGRWLPLEADADLVLRARAGEAVAGPLYRADDGELYLTAYAPLAGQEGWVVAVEGSAALGAVDGLARRQGMAAVLVLLVVTVLGGLLATRIARPLRQLEADLLAIQPGDPPEGLTPAGPREVFEVATAAQRLLAAIRDRDHAVAEAHASELAKLTRLAAGVAHEIRNPLNAMTLSVRRLPRLGDADRRAALAERLQEQLDELEGLVVRLVDLTKPLHPTLRTVDLARLVERLDDEQAIEVALRGRSPTLHTDPALLTEVLRNLVLNATQAGATRVTVTPVPDGLHIADDGPGIDAPDEVFQWFHTTRAKGTGLGLPMSRRIAQALGGDLVVQSPRPTCFLLTLPRSP